jgi:hypothetical protein
MAQLANLTDVTHNLREHPHRVNVLSHLCQVERYTAFFSNAVVDILRLIAA